MTARDERVVWTVPGAASDPHGCAAERVSPPFFPCLSSVVFGRREGKNDRLQERKWKSWGKTAGSKAR